MVRYEEALSERFGLDSFRPWQLEAIEELLHGKRRALVVAPTGGGKSLCYQFPATELKGTSIVVSPLIALMEDQVRGLEAVGISATWLSSTVEPAERRQRMRGLIGGKYKLVYIAPERLTKGGMLDVLSRLDPPFIAIDEAHCISQWGHDFRPDYLRLREVLRALEPAHVLACTATATPLVRDEIVEQLGLSPSDTAVILRGFARPNLHLSVEELDESTRRKTAMLAALKETLGSAASPKGAAIVYAATRKQTEQLAGVIRGEGFRVGAYHAGLAGEIRARVNQQFAQGDLDVVVATNAFGMGIDRPDIRAVIHVQAPGSIEAYYQEVGRAGRDGQPALGLLLCSSADFGLRRRLIEKSSAAPAERPSQAHIDRQWKLFLDLMRYVEAGSCRHDFILKYFGDHSETLGGCGHCDICEMLEELGEAEGERKVSDDDALIIRKALSAVARSRCRVGLNAVVDTLCGSDNKQQRRLGFDHLSTYGLLKTYPRPWVQSLLRRLVTSGLVDITADEYPLIFLTGLGAKTMKGEEPVRVILPRQDAGRTRRGKVRKSSPSKQALFEQLSPVDVVLFEKLRLERSNLAQVRSVPPYVICHDRTLAEIALRRPSTLAELGEVHGMGPARLTAYGERFLEVVEER